ncbi:MAG TPA: SpoIIE family protein phosphatase [Spirochaetota bacterium]|nr:SpoIIE family protein phosphatase [Spirochaetota bacterium]HOT20550.1 SpoIIE family protein phosphatase [Spirochaetota bacterium]HPD05712.1 SpoIIE family protein phosphatase [Spirochaetota bacterium]HQK07111.1 SpoIIE family protein phosphatase [Spirochaetota bacterium]HRR61673.1 SpoIIE family protein phosphatase [Spirochaetota bacterium]
MSLLSQHNTTVPKNILVIDDSKLNRAIVKNTLLNYNIHVFEAADGLEGLTVLQSRHFDLILLDIVMPNMDGFGFLEQCKQYIGDDFIPIILMTGLDDLNSKIKGLSIGADDFLLKPLNQKELIARVQSLLRLKQAHDELYEKNQQIQKELEYAKRLQQFIIPKDFSFISYPSISGRYLPIADIGGDLFDCYKISDSKTGVLIADVTGHGIPAALVMSMAKMTFNIHSYEIFPTQQLMSKINEEMRGLLLDMQYITAFYMLIDNEHKNIAFTNAGHTRPLYYRKSTDKIIALDTNGLFLGIQDESLYEQKSIHYESGDRCILYTDGITELKDDHNEEFGEVRLAKFLKQHNNASGSFCDNLLQTLEHFAPLNERSDDIAFLFIEF